ncbi:MAG: acyl-CoA thioesterase [Panacagrimonas sp.]
MSDPFRYWFRVRYGECDAQKVVFNARYGDYVDIAITEFFRALGYGAELVSGEFDFQLVKQTKQWRGPARFDDVIEARVRAVNLGNTSFTLEAEFRIAGTEPMIFTCETVYVLVDRQLQKQALPGDLRARLGLGATGQVDHAQWIARK